MNKRSLVSFALRAVATLVVAFVGWVVFGYLATRPLGAIYGWSGHPSIPGAPVEVYVGLYLVVLPVLCLLGAWTVVRWAAARLSAKESHASGA